MTGSTVGMSTVCFDALGTVRPNKEIATFLRAASRRGRIPSRAAKLDILACRGLQQEISHGPL